MNSPRSSLMKRNLKLTLRCYSLNWKTERIINFFVVEQRIMSRLSSFCALVLLLCLIVASSSATGFGDRLLRTFLLFKNQPLTAQDAQSNGKRNLSYRSPNLVVRLDCDKWKQHMYPSERNPVHKHRWWTNFLQSDNPLLYPKRPIVWLWNSCVGRNVSNPNQGRF